MFLLILRIILNMIQMTGKDCMDWLCIKYILFPISETQNNLLKLEIKCMYLSYHVDTLRSTCKFTCLLGNLYAVQEAIVRMGHGITGWFQIGKGVCQGCILSSSLFNVYAEYIMQNARLDEAQAGIKIVGRNINSLRYEDDTTHMAERKRN